MNLNITLFGALPFRRISKTAKNDGRLRCGIPKKIRGFNKTGKC